MPETYKSTKEIQGYRQKKNNIFLNVQKWFLVLGYF